MAGWLTYVCCGPLGTNKNEQVMKPIMTTDTKMTGKPDAMALSGRTNVNISFFGGVVPSHVVG